MWIPRISYVMQINHEIHFAWQAQHMVIVECHFSQKAQRCMVSWSHFSWQVQHLVTSERHFSWQVQHVVKFAVDSGSAKCCNLQKTMRLQCSDHGRIGRALEMTLQPFSASEDLGVQFCAAGTVFAEVGSNLSYVGTGHDQS